MAKQSNVDVVLLFSAETDDRLYQLRQWIKPLERLAKLCSFAVVTVNERSAQVLEGTELAHKKYSTLEESLALYDDLKPKVVLYVNKGIRSLLHTAIPNVTHVYIGHGESDKSYSADNTMKYFDYIFLSGPLGVKRLIENVSDFPVEDRCIIVGRPQHLDSKAPPLPGFKKNENKITVLYTPTADFLSVANQYGTVATHGVEIIRQLLAADEQYQIIYKPHPLVGSRIDENILANQKIISLLEEAGGDHLYDQSPFGWHLDYADVMVTDISAVAYDWLATGKPLIVTKPAPEGVEIYRNGILGDLELLDKGEAKNIGAHIQSAISGTTLRNKLDNWRHEYFSNPVDEATGQEKFSKAIISLLNNHSQSTNVDSSSLLTGIQGDIEANNKPQAIPSQKNLIQRLLKGFAIFASNLAKPKADRWIVHLYEQKLDFKTIAALSKNGQTSLLISGYRNFLDVLIRIIRNPKLAKSLSPRYTPGRKYVARAIARQLPEEILYLSHGSKNHFAMRYSGTVHHLYLPDSLKNFKVNHNLVAYDKVTLAKDATKEQIETEITIPEGWAKKLFSLGR